MISPQKGFHVFDILFFTDEAFFHLSGHINCQISRIWNAENARALHENTLYSSKEVFSAKCLEKELWDNCSINRFWEGGGGRGPF
jgi:hypothetical protein